MRKTFFLFLTVLISLNLANAQADYKNLKNSERRHSIGFESISVGFGSAMTNVNGELRYGYMLQNRLNFGANIGYSYYGKYYNRFSIGPNVKYYFSEKRFTPFISFKSNLHFINIGNPSDASETLIHGVYNFGSNIAWENTVGFGVSIKTKNEKFSIEGSYNVGKVLINSEVKNIAKPVITVVYNF